METKDLKEITDDLTNHVGNYLDTFYEAKLLNVVKKTVNIASATISTILVYVLGVFVLFFFSFAAAWWLGRIMNNTVAAFMIVAGVYLLLGLIIILFRKKIVFPFIRNAIIQKIYE